MKNIQLTTIVLIVLSFISCNNLEDHEAITPESFSSIKLRAIGPGAYGGRISEILVHPDDDSIIYISASTGGIFKSSDNCRSWIPVFDKAGSSLAIGDMDISITNPDLLWAGTGEASGEQNPASVGDGIYKSIDGGLSWQNMGLKNTRHFSKVVIHPGNDDIVFAGATGSRWGSDNQRGVYRTKDGGQSWDQVLFINDNTGISDIAVHPDGEIIFASAWEQRRSAWAHVRQGKSSGLYRSEDTGISWEKITNGLPEGKAGRIALAIAESNPDIVYACYEHDSLGLFRSDDRGISWKNINNEVFTSYWYGRIYVDPTDEDHIFIMDVHIKESVDGGKNFTAVIPGRNVHVDHHVLWINPSNTDHRLLGNDGGLYRTYDGNTNWTFIANLPIGQYYDISIDNRDPYWIYGGLQDNGVWAGPSRSVGGILINNDDIVHISGGDGFYSAVDPNDNNIVFSESQYGFIGRYNYLTEKRKRIKPEAEEGKEYRFNWNTPFFISRHEPHKLFIGAQQVLKSGDSGDSWEEISTDLTAYYDLDTIMVIGEKPVIKSYFTITALAESPLKKGVIYAGTDDGRLHITKDEGESWVDISSNIPAPEDRFITRIIASAHKEGRAYLGFGRFYEDNDLSPYIYVTEDYGNSWEFLGAGLPDMAIVRSIAEHPSNPDLLFAGTNNALYLSFDRGQSWLRPKTNLPYVGVDDILIEEGNNDLILGTYGRGIWILDNISFLSEFNSDTEESDFYLFNPYFLESGNNIAARDSIEQYYFSAPDPEEGVIITYYLKKNYKNKRRQPELYILKPDGSKEFIKNIPVSQGFNRISVNTEDASNNVVVLKLGKREILKKI